MPSIHDRIATFNYLGPTVMSSLFRNGRVLVHRDPGGSDSRSEGLDLEATEVTVADARALVERPSLERNGFELVDAPLSDPGFDFFDTARVVGRYYPEVAEVVAGALGARYAVAFDHNLRWAEGKKAKQRLEGGQDVQAPVQLVHGDYTLTSAPERLRQLARPPRGNDTLKDFLPLGESVLNPDHVEQAIRGERRFAIVNLWRNIHPEPVQKHPIAVCDARTIDPEDLVVFEIHYQDRIGENYFAKHADAHRWRYYPAMTRDEPMLIQQWDSAGALASSDGRTGDGATFDCRSTFSLHSAFEDAQSPPDAPERCSVEVRCVVMFD